MKMILVRVTRVKVYTMTKRKRSYIFLCQNPYTNKTFEKANGQHKNATKDFDYIRIAKRLSTIIWSKNSHQTIVVKTG